MDLCVGAGSRRVVEEAAKLKVPQIVASRRQVTPTGGYTGLNNDQLVETVRRLSDGQTAVVRDHGGPYQNGDPDDDWVAAFDADIEAGFDALHIDVCKLPRDEQVSELDHLLQRYASQVDVEIGGERDEQDWLSHLFAFTVGVADITPLHAVADVGGHIWADRQEGYFKDPALVKTWAQQYHEYGVKIKAHNCDFLGNKRRYEGALDAMNIAPEFGNIEIDAWLRVIAPAEARTLLNYGYDTHSWTRWFNEGEGTSFERARAALRYHLEDSEVQRILEQYDDSYVRSEIRDALEHGLD